MTQYNQKTANIDGVIEQALQSFKHNAWGDLIVTAESDSELKQIADLILTIINTHFKSARYVMSVQDFNDNFYKLFKALGLQEDQSAPKQVVEENSQKAVTRNTNPNKNVLPLSVKLPVNEQGIDCSSVLSGMFTLMAKAFSLDIIAQVAQDTTSLSPQFYFIIEKTPNSDGPMVTIKGIFYEGYKRIEIKNLTTSTA